MPAGFFILLPFLPTGSVKVRRFVKECLHPRTDCVKMGFIIEVSLQDKLSGVWESPLPAGTIVRGYSDIPKG